MCKKPVSGKVVIPTPAPYPSGGCANGFIRVPGGRKSFISVFLYLLYTYFWPSETESPINELRFSDFISLSFKTRLTSVICFCGNVK